MAEAPVDYEKIRAIIKSELKPLWEKVHMNCTGIDKNKDAITKNTTNLIWLIWFNRIVIGMNFGIGSGIIYMIFK